jgi:alpha-1,3-glucosyltransferase
MSANVTPSISVAVLSTLVLIRVLVGFQPHSGQDNFHGKLEAYGGDYEAQRHWMELTLHLPIGNWYWYDLEYWGLDYPPLTAYQSWLCGYLSHRLVGPESVALDASRGFEDPIHKAYMRATVLVLDILVYFSAMWLAARRENNAQDSSSMWTLILALTQPALILMDHGHFQYNSVSLGFALWSFYFVTKKEFRHCILGSFFFCLALNFKQMTLYYAPAIFAYLLGRCFAEQGSYFMSRFCRLGAVVILTFALHWWPFIYYPPLQQQTTLIERLKHVFHRMFPFQRGLFEGKVSNLWCALSTKPISIRRRIPENHQPIVALVLTLLLVMPACYKLFLVGRSSSMSRPNDWKALLWGTASTSLASFLVSFQVHEKSILMALSPISLLLWDDALFVSWFSVVSTWTLWPLICIDRLEAAYLALLTIFLSLVILFLSSNQTSVSCMNRLTISKVVLPISCIGMVGLHFLEFYEPPPVHLPDLFPVLWSVAGCGLFCVSWLVTCWQLYKIPSGLMPTGTRTFKNLDR